MTIKRALKLSKPEVGSSKRITLGSVIISTPIAVLFFSPPDSTLWCVVPILESAIYYSPKSLRIYSTLKSCSIIDNFNFRRAAKVNASLGVKYPNRISSYITYAPIDPKTSWVNSILSFIKVFPVSFAPDLLVYILSEITFSKEVFPDPEAPIINTVSPDWA